jgi:hypothetical protein
MVRKWVDRYCREGAAGPCDRSSRPHRVYRAIPQACRRAGRNPSGLRTGQQIAADLRLSPETVSRNLRRRGLNRISALAPCEPVRRFERTRPGEMIHSDIKSSAGSMVSAIASSATATVRTTGDQVAKGLAGSLSMSPSMTTRASPSPS